MVSGELKIIIAQMHDKIIFHAGVSSRELVRLVDDH
jgi:hypothetical protein